MHPIFQKIFDTISPPFSPFCDACGVDLPHGATDGLLCPECRGKMEAAAKESLRRVVSS